jgi:hypothetical protein
MNVCLDYGISRAVRREGLRGWCLAQRVHYIDAYRKVVSLGQSGFLALRGGKSPISSILLVHYEIFDK